VVSGVLGTLGDLFSLDVKLVDVATGQEIRRVAQTWSGDEAFSIEAMRQVATKLLRPEAYKGRLDVQVNQAGVQVFLDGAPVGRTPLGAPLPVSPGRHALKLVSVGFEDYERFVDVPFDRVVAVSVEMKGTAISGVVPSREQRERFAVGLRAGLFANAAEFVAPAVGLELAYRLPLWGGRLSVMLESGAYGSWDQRTSRSDALGRIPVKARILVWPVQLHLMLRLLPDYPFSPYVGAGGGFFLVWQTLRPEGLPEQAFRDGVFGFQAQGGVEYRLGPGVIFLEARYQHVRVDAPADQGGVEGLLGGLGAALGYRLML
jgi:hypothetical protein